MKNEESVVQEVHICVVLPGIPQHSGTKEKESISWVFLVLDGVNMMGRQSRWSAGSLHGARRSAEETEEQEEEEKVRKRRYGPKGIRRLVQTVQRQQGGRLCQLPDSLVAAGRLLPPSTNTTRPI
ncbi:hypothetical protein E2C01_029364 [Portunus trituberculatus]|uniref:Uncharacterized protein n=1 Tax=Portunus trituberculatus TaxID=210409 RepID=A0A5B7ERA0_PORTR|nr:hypothetical protein [Portunus trituberculatus]